MKTDAYTKTILTIIAVCVVILAAKSFDSGLLVSTAHAETKNIMDVNIVQINGQGVNTGVVSPSINGASLPINIQRINGEDFSRRRGQPLPVRIQE
jgi:hypothetical protein